MWGEWGGKGIGREGGRKGGRNVRTLREFILIGLELLLILPHIARILVEEHLRDTHTNQPRLVYRAREKEREK